MTAERVNTAQGPGLRPASLSLPRQFLRPRVAFSSLDAILHSFTPLSATMDTTPHQHASSSNHPPPLTLTSQIDSSQDPVQTAPSHALTLPLSGRPVWKPSQEIKKDAFALKHCFEVLSLWQLSRYARDQTRPTLDRVCALLNVPIAEFWPNETMWRNQVEEELVYAVMCAVCFHGYHHIVMDDKPWFVIVEHPGDNTKPVMEWLKNKPFMVFTRANIPIFPLTELHVINPGMGRKREGEEEEQDVKRLRL
ncbi:hypothetical protein K491DRAFT_368880 [Lophiostoma macrostomum CBS 122681]|uniref:Uncharacterized protein n=1 Tax=Lophiostoma macrostomum CBS 122681 TaxID=1314788 RepID=A0A6A6T9F3_9PLEO|nr:hypothetical protein K491DRAFT_368880 [Lophiostoma macrostomum CBS 122681]